MHGRILIVDDDQSMCKMLEADLSRRGFTPSWHTTAEEAFTILKDKDIDVLLADLYLPGMNGIDLCERVTANRPDVSVVVMTAFGSLDMAVAAIRAGAYDFVAKPIDTDILALSLKRAVKHKELQEKVKILSEEINRYRGFHDLIGNSPPMRELLSLITRVADTETSVLISGESGTGKELVARNLHKQSRRHAKPFVAINCAALPDTLLESELFGYKRGAFTDAKSDRKGLFSQAEGGTLFLDEVGQIPAPLQPKLLRALEERTMRPLGSSLEVHFNVRIICATNLDLESAVSENRFREDLFYRINVINISVPPLCSRGTDILLIAQYFIEQFASRSGRPVKGISKAAAEKLMNYSWPGNVRELRNTIERAVTLTRYEEIAVEDFPEKIRAYKNNKVLIGSNNPTELISMEEVERRYILHVLKTLGGNRTLAAKTLGLDRKTLYRKLQGYGNLK